MIIEDWLRALAAGPWALPVLFALVFADAILVVVPGEVAVAAFGALAAFCWSAYQAVVGAIVGWLVPGGPLLAVVVSIVVAIAIGMTIDAIVARTSHHVQSCGEDVREDGIMTEPRGYDADFLALAVPLPTAASTRDVRVLAYPRFSVSLDTGRQLAVVTGVNIDGATLHDLPRTGEWELDPRVPADQQTGPEVYARNDLDRGHLVRRRDPGWGTTAEARAATEATFCYTNAAPQAAAFNQSKDLWLGLEDHVLRYADTLDLRVSVFTAPVLAEADPPYRGIGIPRRFWKVAAWATASASGDAVLAAAGFVLDQSELIDTSAGLVEVPPLGSYRTFQVPIAHIETLAGVDLGPLVTADTLAAVSARDRAEWRELRTPADIVLDERRAQR